MESHSSNEDSEFIDIEALNTKSNVGKKVKKAPSVCFAPESSTSNPSVQDDAMEGMTEEDIRTEIYSFLPSNTLGRSRLRSLSNAQARKAHTLPRTFFDEGEEGLAKKLRSHSFVAKRKSIFFQSLSRRKPARFAFDDFADGDSTDYIDSLFTDEEKVNELSNIKNIPIRLSEKKKYRVKPKETQRDKNDQRSDIMLQDRSMDRNEKGNYQYSRENSIHRANFLSDKDRYSSRSGSKKKLYDQIERNHLTEDKSPDNPEKDVPVNSKGEYVLTVSGSINKKRCFTTDDENLAAGFAAPPYSSEKKNAFSDPQNTSFYTNSSRHEDNEENVVEIYDTHRKPHLGYAITKNKELYRSEYAHNSKSKRNDNLLLPNQIDDYHENFERPLPSFPLGEREKYLSHNASEENVDNSYRYSCETTFSRPISARSVKKREKRSVRKPDLDELEDRCNAFESSANESGFDEQASNIESSKTGYGNDHNVAQQRFYNSEANERGIKYNATVRSHKAGKNTSYICDTMTMSDAFKISQLICDESEEENKTCDIEIPQSIETLNCLEITSLETSRKCWSKLCLSKSKHSHITEKNLFNNIKREAILETIPLKKSRDKSWFSKVSESCVCFKRLLESLHLWDNTLKRIEGQHGTGVVSYFVFLRWLILLNLIMFLLCFFLVTLPHAVFPLLPLKDLNIAPNSSLLTEEYLSQFPDHQRSYLRPKSPKNASRKLHDEDILSNLGELFDHYLPEEILDITLSYDKRNFTTKERHTTSQFCEEKYKNQLMNRSFEILSSLQDFLQGTGWLESTVLFLGFYPPNEISYFGVRYNMPVAIISAVFVSFFVCFCMMIQYSSHGIQERILARKGNYLAYSNLLFCSWDYCIEDRKSSIIRHNSILQEMKSTLIDERRRREVKEWSQSKKIKVYTIRTLVNILVLCIICSSYYLIYKVVDYQLKELQMHRLSDSGVNTLLIQYLSPIVITGLNIIVPIFFNNIVKLEMYNTQTQINIALFRIVFLRLSSVFVLVGMLYLQIICEPKDQCLEGYQPWCHSPLCWETYVGQQLYKLAVTDFFVYMIMFLVYDLPRDVIVCRFKNKVTQMIGRQVFDLPNQVLALVYSQTLCWLGIIYSPLIPAITVLKFFILFHVKKVMVLKYCSPAPISYKASRSNAMFMMILMLSFFALLIIHGFSLSSILPSPACSPFRFYSTMLESINEEMSRHSLQFAIFMKFLFSGLFFIPAMILLCIAIYYYWTIIVAQRKMMKVLKAQIVLEGRDKQFLLNRLTEVAKGHVD